MFAIWFSKAFIWCAYEFTWFFKSLIWISCVYMRFMCLYDVHMWLNDFRMFDMMFICCLYNVYMRLYVVLMCVNKCHMLVIWFSNGLVWCYYIVKCFSCICMIFYVYMMIVTCLKKWVVINKKWLSHVVYDVHMCLYEFHALEMIKYVVNLIFKCV